MADAGRPSDYESEFAEQARKLCELGATDMELADFFKVNVSTIYRWRNVHPSFCEAVIAGKGAADARVERALFNRAVGYDHDAVKIFMPANAAQPVYAPYREHVPPDSSAAMNWLKNRQPDKWRDKHEHALSGGLDVTAKVDLSALTPDQLRAIASIPIKET